MSPDTHRVWVISGPSGAGKSTLIRRVMEGRDDLTFSVSHTTRERRAGEQDGVDYHFVSRETFEAMIRREEFVEWARVHNHLYGTSRAAVNRAREAGKTVILDIDVQGGVQVRRVLADAGFVFVAPPSAAVLRERLGSRGRGEDGEEIALRLHNARTELLAGKEYDHVVINGDLEAAAAELRELLGGSPLPGPAPAHLEAVANSL